MKTCLIEQDGWTVSLLDDGSGTSDEGREICVAITHTASRMALRAEAVYYAGSGDSITTKIVQDDLMLPEHASRRLAAKCCSSFMRTVGDYGDCGLVATMNLNSAIKLMYADPAEADVILAFIDTAIRSLWTPNLGGTNG